MGFRYTAAAPTAAAAEYNGILVVWLVVFAAIRYFILIFFYMKNCTFCGLNVRVKKKIVIETENNCVFFILSTFLHRFQTIWSIAMGTKFKLLGINSLSLWRKWYKTIESFSSSKTWMISFIINAFFLLLCWSSSSLFHPSAREIRIEMQMQMYYYYYLERYALSFIYFFFVVASVWQSHYLKQNFWNFWNNWKHHLHMHDSMMT